MPARKPNPRDYYVDERDQLTPEVRHVSRRPDRELTQRLTFAQARDRVVGLLREAGSSREAIAKARSLTSGDAPALGELDEDYT